MLIDTTTPKVEHPRLKREWVGRYVRLKHVTRNGAGTIFEKGEVLRVDRTYRGSMTVETIKKCEHCKRRTFTSIKLGTNSLEVLPIDYDPEKGLVSNY